MIPLLLTILALFGAPLFIIIAWIALMAFTAEGISTQAVMIEMYRMASQPVLVAVPLFTFAGFLLAESGAPSRMVRLSKLLLSWLPGGLAVVSLIICAVFTAFTGASGVTIIALGGLLMPVLIREGYSERFSLGLMTTSGSLGLLFPPSLPLILYGLVAGVSVDRLFRAGLLPGLLILVILSLYSMWQARKHNHGTKSTAPSKQNEFSSAELWNALKDAAWELPLPPLILFLIYGGYITPAEASAVTALWVLITVSFIKRELPLKNLPKLIVESMSMVGAILMILGAALGLTNYLVDAEIPQRLLEWMQGFTESRIVFLLTLNVFLLVVGCLMDIFSAIVVVVPLIVPVAAQFGVDPVHLGIIFLTNLEIGYLTPPVGLNLFIASYRFKKPVLALYRASLPWLGLLLLALIAITWWPALSLGLLP
jgi:C4-dicarboxylate transporter, DctM subunit